jgi:cysteinyl-tRNA synthetase
MDKIRLITLFRAPVQSVKIFDTLSGEKEEFAAIANSNNSVVKMLLCGPTVYDYSHVGHARMLLFYDLMARHFRAKGMHVSAIVNITDVDPKIFKKAKATNTPPSELAAKFIGELLRDLSALGIESFAFARVSHHVGTAQELVAGLLRDGRAYSIVWQAGRNVKARPSRLQAGHFASQEIARGHFAVECQRKPGCRVF